MKLKKDKYSRARGGTSQLLDISCASCKVHLVTYQKDGPGSLLRMYLDRMEPTLPHTNLVCVCGALIATPMVYKPESRLALRMVKGSFAKKKV